MIKSIICCCGAGIGSSVIVKLNVEKVLSDMGITGVTVEHASLSDTRDGAADLFIVGKELSAYAGNLSRVILLDRVMDREELGTKLKAELDKDK